MQKTSHTENQTFHHIGLMLPDCEKKNSQQRISF